MQEGKSGVKRLLRAIENNIDDSNREQLARLLNYYEPQLKEDIEAIAHVRIADTDG